MPLSSSAHYDKFKGMHVLGQPWKARGGVLTQPGGEKGQETIKEEGRLPGGGDPQAWTWG